MYVRSVVQPCMVPSIGRYYLENETVVPLTKLTSALMSVCEIA